MARSRKRKKTIIFSAIGLVLALLVLMAVFRKKETVITVQTEKVTRRNLTELVVANGRIQPVTQVTISPEVSGEIIELPVKEGQHVEKGQLLVKIKPDYYLAALNQAKASYQSSLAGKAQSEATFAKAEAEFKRNHDLYTANLISESDFIGYKASYDIARAQMQSASDQVEMAKAAVASAQDSLDKTTITSPLTGTITSLNSQLGERVLGTVQNMGTTIMTIADLNEMEARVNIGEMDVVLMKPGQKARLEVDAFKDCKFTGTVTQIANSAEGLSSASSSSSSQEATKFQVRIHINEKQSFRPGMSVTAEIETRYRTNVLTVPIASVTTRLPKRKPKPAVTPGNTNSESITGTETNTLADAATNSVADSETNAPAASKKPNEPPKPVDVVFVVEGDHVKMVPVKIGISDDNYWEITDGLKGGEEVVSGGFRAISRELEDGSKIRKGGPGLGPGKEAESGT